MKVHSSSRLLCVLCTLWAAHLCARDAFVFISGGDNVLANNYSQYLQARAMAAALEAAYPPDSVWVFFGAGNIEGRPIVLRDVHRQIDESGALIDSWLAGALARNRRASHDNIVRALKEEIMPAVSDGGTLFLFVGDHGMRSEGSKPESLIVLWNDPSAASGRRSSFKPDSIGVAELRGVLAGGLGKGRVVFCMTQCHSGGFHYLAMPHEMVAEPQWFRAAHSTFTRKDQESFPQVAGFTATDEYSPAAGCEPDPDPAKWAGYERFFPEKLLDTDLMAPFGRPRLARYSLLQASCAATLEDFTIDQPRRTSEQYLERWSDLIETHLLNASDLQLQVRAALDEYRRTVDGAAPKTTDSALQERQVVFNAFVQNLILRDPSLTKLLRSGSEKELDEAAAQAEGASDANPGQLNRPRPLTMRRARRLWQGTVRPAWKKAVDAGAITNLTPAALALEKQLLSAEDRGRDFLFSDAAEEELEIEIYWRGGYGDPRNAEPDPGGVVSRWGARRTDTILDWAQASGNARLRSAGKRLAQDWLESEPEPSTPLMSRDIAAARVLFYRRVLAAWEFLLAVNDRPALDQLAAFDRLEHTSLPEPGATRSR